MRLPWGTNSPANDYTYNHKELNEDFGLNWHDYGARWYDAALGKWWSVDPLAEKFYVWSPYHYAMANPMRMIDPDGRTAQDIIIRYHKEMSADERKEYEQKILQVLQNITDDKISIKNGKVKIDEKKEGSKRKATSVVREFVEGAVVNGKFVKKDVTIYDKFVGMDNATTVVDISTNNPNDAKNGKGVSNSIISFDPDSDAGKGYYPPGSDEKAISTNEAALLHELVHARRNAFGVAVTRDSKSCTNCKRGISLEEAQVQKAMNEKFHPENPSYIPLTDDPYNN